MPQADTGVGTLHGKQSEARQSDEEEDDGEKKGDTALIAKPFSEKSLVPSPMHLHMNDAENEKGKADQHMEDCPIVPHLVAIAVSGDMEFNARIGGEQERRDQRPIDDINSFHSFYYLFFSQKKCEFCPLKSGV